MNPDHPSHDASASLPDLNVERDVYMALRNASLDWRVDMLTGVVGPSPKGACKSTLFNAIAGLLPVQQGESNA